MGTIRGLVILATVVAFSLPGTATASVREKLRKELEPLVQGILRTADQEKQTTLAVGEFTRPAQVKASVGLGIEQLLIEELTRLKPNVVNRDSKFSVTGQVKLLEEGANKLVRLVVKLELTSGTELGEIKKDLFDSEIVAFLLGLTVQLPPTDNREQLQGRIAESFNGQKPGGKVSFVLRNGNKQVATGEQSPYGVELLVTHVKNTPKNVTEWSKVPSRELKGKDGYPVLPVDQKEVVALRLINKSDHEAAITVALDGVDVFQLAERKPGEKPPFSHYIIPAKGEALVTGWFLNLNTVSSFLVTGEGQGVVTKLGAPRGQIGTITVTFAAAWEGDMRPADEAGKRAGGKEFGEGPPSEAKAEPVKRTVGVIRDIITILYDR